MAVLLKCRAVGSHKLRGVSTFWDYLALKVLCIRRLGLYLTGLELGDVPLPIVVSYHLIAFSLPSGHLLLTLTLFAVRLLLRVLGHLGFDSLEPWNVKEFLHVINRLKATYLGLQVLNGGMATIYHSRFWLRQVIII